MKTSRRLNLVCFALLLVSALSACSTLAVNEVPTLDGDQATLLVVIDDPRDARRKLGISGPGYAAHTAYQHDPALHRAAKAIAEDHGVEILAEWPLKNLDAHCFVIAKPVASIANAIAGDSRVRWVQPLNTFETRATTATATVPNSPIFDRFAADIMERGRNVDIAVVDTAVDSTHPGFRHSNLSVRNFAGTRGDAGKEAHGTAVVGLIAAKSPSNSGLSGLAHEANVHALRGCWQESEGVGRCNTLTLSLALNAAIDLNVDIVNLSISGPQDRALSELIAKLTAKGTLVIAAYDDQRGLDMRFPQPQDGVVYAYGLGERSEIPLANNILFAQRHALSLTPMAGYDVVSGHSIATPQLTAIAACLIERYPFAERAQIVRQMRDWLQRNFVPAESLTASLSHPQ